MWDDCILEDGHVGRWRFVDPDNRQSHSLLPGNADAFANNMNRQPEKSPTRKNAKKQKDQELRSK
jgi:hypothetical protein